MAEVSSKKINARAGANINFESMDAGSLEQCFRTMREVRKKRSKASHTVIPEAYNEALFEEQRLLFVQAYEALRTIRVALQSKPKAEIELEKMDQRVREGDIWFQ